jgi:hypothetical protein
MGWVRVMIDAGGLNKLRYFHSVAGHLGEIALMHSRSLNRSNGLLLGCSAVTGGPGVFAALFCQPLHILMDLPPSPTFFTSIHYQFHQLYHNGCSSRLPSFVSGEPSPRYVKHYLGSHGYKTMLTCLQQTSKLVGMIELEI